ncbi:MAG: O-antigen ligase family protein [Flexilinea sp.]
MPKNRPVKQKNSQSVIPQKSIWAHVPEWLTSLYIVIILGMFPIWFDNFGFTAILQAKHVFFLYAVTGYLILLVLSLILLTVTHIFHLPPVREIPKKLWNGTNFPQKAIACLALIACFSSILSLDRTVAWNGYIRFEGLQTKLLYWATFFAISIFGKCTPVFIGALGFSSTFMGIISILQYTGQNPFLLFPAGTSYPLNDLTKMFIGTVGNVDSAAGICCIALPIFLSAVILFETKFRFLLIPPLLLNTFVLLFTGAQQGLVGIGGGMVLMLPFLLNSVQRIRNASAAGFLIFLTAAFQRSLIPTVSPNTGESGGVTVDFSLSVGNSAFIFLAAAVLSGAIWLILHFAGAKMKINGERFSRVIAVGLIFILITGLAFLWFAPAGQDPANGLVHEASRLLHGNIDESFGSNRLFVWTRVPQLVREFPVLGSGPDTFGPRFMAAFTQDMVERFKKAFLFDHAENEYLSLLVNLGFLGLAAYLAALGGEAANWLRRKKNRNGLILGSALFCSSIQLLFTSSSVIVSPLLWIIWGLLNAQQKSRPEKTGTA